MIVKLRVTVSCYSQRFLKYSIKVSTKQKALWVAKRYIRALKRKRLKKLARRVSLSFAWPHRMRTKDMPQLYCYRDDKLVRRLWLDHGFHCRLIAAWWTAESTRNSCQIKSSERFVSETRRMHERRSRKD